MSPASSLLSFIERTDRLRSKDMTIVNNGVRDASLRVVFHAIEREISLSNNATLIQSELTQMFFIA